jgi:hypothetical protein
MLGCLAGHAIKRTKNPSGIKVAMHVSGGLSRGSAVSAMCSVTTETLARAVGKLSSGRPEPFANWTSATVPSTACG